MSITIYERKKKKNIIFCGSYFKFVRNIRDIYIKIYVLFYFICIIFIGSNKVLDLFFFTIYNYN